MDKQRLYDAMLIKAFRQDRTVGQLWWWLRGLGIEIPDKTLLRQPPTSKMRVQAFVGIYLKPLADRLWDTDRNKDIETLNWMANLDNQRTSGGEKDKLMRKIRVDRTRQELLHHELERHRPNNQWHVTKGKIRIGRIK
jgi:hypothetical protein